MARSFSRRARKWGIVLLLPLLAAGDGCPTTTSTTGAVRVTFPGLPPGALSIGLGSPIPAQLVSAEGALLPSDDNTFGSLEPGTYTIRTDTAYTEPFQTSGMPYVPDAAEMTVEVTADNTTTLAMPYHAATEFGVVLVDLQTTVNFGFRDMLRVVPDGTTDTLPATNNQALVLAPGEYHVGGVPFTFDDRTYVLDQPATPVSVIGGQVVRIVVPYLEVLPE